ncbi:MAG: long-chain fatty acid--CoA ligase [Thermoanaerobaculia bacterium]|nr:long-chain fatty acid--CoA ligase [Thermoanaerobaculia bacterium]
MTATPATLSDLVFHIADRQAGRSRRLASKQGRSWQWLSTEDLVGRVHHLCLAMEEDGVEAGDRIALFSENCPEWHIVDLACQLRGAVTVPIYPTLPTDQVAYILEDSGCSHVFFRGSAKADLLEEARGSLSQPIAAIAMFDEEGPGVATRLADLVARGEGRAEERPLESFRGAVAPEQLASLIYTSGTTGNPKGVMLTHANLASNFTACADLFPIGDDDITLSFLPLSHVFQRTVDYLFLYKGVTIHYLTSIEQAPRAFGDVRPTIMASVPRLYERAYLRVLGNVAKESTGKRRIFSWAVDVGERASQRSGRFLPPHLAVQRGLAQRLVYRQIQERLGGRLRFAIAGGAARPEQIGKFFAAVGIGLYEGYGLTETSPVLCVNRPGHCRYGTVGQTIPGVELRVAADGEILAKTPGLMQGYWNLPEATAEAIDDEGWFHTGDVGEIDGDGYLRITDRKKDLLVTSGGKNVAPQPIEQLLTADGTVLQAVVIGDGYPYLTALLVPNFDDLPAEIADLDPAARIAQPRLLERVETTVSEVNRRLAEHERIRRWRLMEREFSLDAGEITPTLKIRRKVVLERYSDRIADMYLKSQRLETRGAG